MIEQPRGILRVLPRSGSNQEQGWPASRDGEAVGDLATLDAARQYATEHQLQLRLERQGYHQMQLADCAPAAPPPDVMLVGEG